MASHFAGILENFMEMSGGPVTVFRDYGTPHQTERTFQALKNTKTKSGGGDIFQFLKHEDIEEGDIIQQKGAFDLWIVTDTTDFMDAGDYLSFDVSVSKANKSGAMRPRPSFGNTVHVAGNVIGGLQVGSTNSTQSITASISNQVITPLNQLSAVVKSSQIDELDKEELLHEIARVEELAKRNDNKAKPKILERLTIIEKGLAVSSSLAAIGHPIVAAVRAHFGI